MSSVPPTTTSDVARSGASSPARRRRRRLSAILVAVVALIGGAYFTVTRPVVLAFLVERGLSVVTGGVVSVDGARWLGGGDVRLDGVTVRVRGWPDDAGELLRAGRIEATISRSRLLAGRLYIKRLDADALVVRIAERTEQPGHINLMDLRRPPRRDPTGPTRLPALSLPDVTIEVGYIDDEGAWRNEGVVRVAGDLRPDPDDPGWVIFDLRERDVDVGALHIAGRLEPNSREFTLSLDQLQLDGSRRKLLPLQARAWWEYLDLTGEIAGATVTVKESEPFTAELRLAHTGMTLPVATVGGWSRFHHGVATPATGRPRLEVDSGMLRLVGLRLDLVELAGSLIGTDPLVPLVGIPFSVDFSLPELPPLTWEYRDDWLEEALSAAAFEMRLDLPGFAVKADAEGNLPAVELPRPVADALAIFRLTEWRMRTSIEVRRGAPTTTIGDDGTVTIVPAPVRAEGRAYVNDARGAYRRFDYPLRSVAAHLTFTDEEVRVDYLTARGSGDSTISVFGTVAPLGPEAGVNLRLVGSDLPIDDALRQALPDGVRRAVDTLVHEPSAEALRAAGLIPDEATIDAARRRRSEIRAASAGSAPDPEELAALGRLIATRPIRIGGTVDVEATVTRDVGIGQPTELRGEIALDGVGAVVDRFPYPVRIVSGRLRVEPDAVDLGPEGLRLETIGGGLGRIDGRLAMPRVDGVRRVRPDLRVTVTGDRPTAALLAAIPPTVAERTAPDAAAWPGATLSRSGRIVEAFGIDAELAAVATVDCDSDGRVRWRTAIELSNGTAFPDTADGSALELIGVRLPAETELRGLGGRIELDGEGLRLADLAGALGDATLAVEGAIGFGAETPTDLAIAIRDLRLDHGQLVAAPESVRPALARLWERHRPEGVIDVRILHEREVRRDEAGRPAPTLTSAVIVPQWVSVLADGERIVTNGRSGRIHARPESVTLDGLQLALSVGEISHGSLLLDGSIAPDSTALTGHWRDAPFESPVIRELLDRLELDGALATHRRLDPAGRFDAEFEVGPDGHHEVRIAPRSLALTLDGQRLHAYFPADDPTGGTVRIVPGAIVLDRLRGQVDGALAAASGTVHLLETSGVAAELRLSIDAPDMGPTTRPGLWALLPGGVRSALSAIDLVVDGRWRMNDAELRFRRDAARWDAHLAGLVELVDASFEAGLRFREFDGRIELSAGGSSDGPPTLHAATSFDRLRVANRRVTSGSGTIRISESGETLHVDDLVGETYGGRVDAFAAVGLRAGLPYKASVNVANAGVAGISRGEEAEQDADEGGGGGRLNGRIDVAGTIGAPERRRGRGGLTVRDGRMAAAPITLRLLQVIQLMVPLSGSLDEADVRFFIDGDRLVFERLDLQSDTLRLVGAGGMDLDGLVLDLRFSSRGRLGLVSELMGGLTDQLFAIEVTGPHDHPRTRVLPLPGIGTAVQGGR